MRIAIIGPTYPYKGGVSQFTTLLVQQLRHNQHQVDFLTWNHQYPSFLYPVEQKDTASKQAITTPAAAILNFYNPFSWLRAAWRIGRHKDERLIVTWITPAHVPVYIVIGILVRLFTKTRLTYLCHNVLSHEPTLFDKLFTKPTLALGHDYIVHSQQDAQKLRGLLGGKKPVAITFHPTFSVEQQGSAAERQAAQAGLRREYGIPETAPVVLFFGYVRAYKGLDWLLKSLPAVLKQEPSVHLLVVGEFWQHDKPTYEALVNELGIAERVHFVDRYVANEAIGQYFSLAKLMVAPYVSATQSGVVQMAYAFDTPVVATRVGGLPDAIDEGVSGMLCPPQDTTALAATITKALRYTKFDVAKTKQRFSWQHYCQLIGLGKE